MKKPLNDLLSQLDQLKKDFLEHNYSLVWKLSNKLVVPRKKPIPEELINTPIPDELINGPLIDDFGSMVDSWDEEWRG